MVAGPSQALLELTYRCNLRCVHCYCVHDDPRTELTTDGWRLVLDDLAEMGTLIVTLSGGEPMLRQDFFEIAAAVRERRFALRIFSNGALITDAVADRFVALGVALVEVSLYGASRETYGEVTGSEASFGRALEGLRRLVSRGVHAKAKMPIIKPLVADVQEVMDLARDLGVKVFMDHTVLPRDDGFLGPLGLAVSDEELDACYKTMRVEGGEPVVVDLDAPVCGIARKLVRIDPFGYIYPCGRVRTTHAGNVADPGGLGVAWNGDGMAGFRAITQADMAVCRGCKYHGLCTVCPAMGMIAGNGPIGPTPAQCQRARVLDQMGAVVV